MAAGRVSVPDEHRSSRSWTAQDALVKTVPDAAVVSASTETMTRKIRRSATGRKICSVNDGEVLGFHGEGK